MMAPTTEIAEITESLMIDEIPVKLRCAACDKLAINAFRMPCCEQSICEECQASLPQACPVCLHEPVDKDDCRPNKALRTTIKVFLKKKGVEREGIRRKELLAQAAVASSTPITPTVEDTPAPEQPLLLRAPASESQPVITDLILESQDTSETAKPFISSDKGPTLSGVDVPQQSIESPGLPYSPRQTSTNAADDNNLQQNGTAESQRSKKQDDTKVGSTPPSQSNASNARGRNLGFDLNGTFPNMTNMSMGDFNPMMQVMQGGLPNNMMGQFPNMMGMPGMAMDPMALSQGMFGSYGGPGMGMNGMSMGMGFDAGQNTYGGFNGQPQPFNQSQYSGHASGMSGSFVASSNYGGNNMPQHQGSFNQMNQHQNFNNDFQHGYHSQGLYNRGRGRGRGNFFTGGRGRGYTPQAYQGRPSINEQAFQSQLPEQTRRRGSPVYTPMQGSESEQQPEQIVNTELSGEVDDKMAKRKDEEQFDKELEPGGAEEVAEVSNVLVGEDKVELIKKSSDSEMVSSEQQPEAGPVSTDKNKPRPIQSILSDESLGATVSHEVNKGPAYTAMQPPTVPAIPTGPSKPLSGLSIPATSPRGHGFGRGFVRGFSDFRALHRGRGSFPPTDSPAHNHASSSVDLSSQAPSVAKGLGVEGAPTGPKALRQAVPNVGPQVPQDPGFAIMGRANNAQARPNGSIKSPSEQAALSRSRSRSRSPSQSLCHSPLHPDPSSHRHMSRYPVSPQRKAKRENRGDRHHRNSRQDDEYYEESWDFKGSRVRDDSSHSSPHRSTHRSLRDYDKEPSRSKHRSHRSHRDRTRSPENKTRSSRKRSKTPELRISGASKRTLGDNHYKDKDEDEGRSSRKRRQRDDDERDYDGKRSRRHKEPALDDQEQNHRSKHGHGGERDSRREAKARERPAESPTEKPENPKVDQHALEREARNRERQMKEIQRRAVMEGKTSGSRGTTNGRVSERRASYKYEDEDLTSRVEKERESNRWG